MLAMSPRGSGMPAYAPHRDLLFRMRAWVQGAGLANLRKREAEFNEAEIKDLNIVAMSIVELVVACQQRAVPLEEIPTRMDHIQAKYPEAYAVVLHETFKALFTQYRTFIGEALPAASVPPTEDAAAKALADAEQRVEKFIADNKA